MNAPLAASASALCVGTRRRKAIRGRRDLAGLDYVEVYPDRVTLCVHFFGKVPEGIEARHVVVEGGERVRDIRVLRAEFHRHEEDDEDCLRVTVDRPGDFSTYWLCLREPVETATRCSFDEPPVVVARPPRGIDPRYACAPFSFRADCPSMLDCRPEPCPAPVGAPGPLIDYLAKDYTSFRRLLLDRLSVTIPQWRERHAADLGVTMVEIIAYVADQLSYYQDAVATEAYLRTARRRISVKRHARLVDYRMHDGCNARAFVTIAAERDIELPLGDLVFAVPDSRNPRGSVGAVDPADIDGNAAPATTFEPVILDPVQPKVWLRAAHSAIRFYRWGEDLCCLPAGATRATLLDQEKEQSDRSTGLDEGDRATSERILDLKRGDVLIFEEVVDPATGCAADADPRHRHAVRLTRDPTPAVDPLDGALLLEIEWELADALPFALCLSARGPTPECEIVDAAVARGNVLLVNSGRRVTEANEAWRTKTEPGEPLCLCDGAATETTVVVTPPRIVLGLASLTCAAPIGDDDTDAGALLRQDPRQAQPVVMLYETGADAAVEAVGWSPATDLLAIDSDERVFVVETDDEGIAHLRFAEGQPGKAGSRFSARYRTGNGRAGNVGRDSILLVALRNGSLSGFGLWPRNPLPAVGGTEPETVTEAKLHAPHAFGRVLARAVTGADYAEVARGDRRLQGAFAELAWTGSWYEANLAVDPLKSTADFDDLSADLLLDLSPMRRIGHDLRLVAARRVPLAIDLDVCLQSGYARGDIEPAVRHLLSAEPLADGTLGFFHPDALGFGQDVIASKLIAAIQTLEGVRRVELVGFARLDGRAADGGSGHAGGVIAIASDEIAQLDSDPNFPERGTLVLSFRGGT